MPELGTSSFLIPSDFGDRNERSGVKNSNECLVVLTAVAKSVIDKQCGLSKEWVFPYNGTAMRRMNDSACRGESGETLAGGKPSPRSPRVRIDQGSRPEA